MFFIAMYTLVGVGRTKENLLLFHCCYFNEIICCYFIAFEKPLPSSLWFDCYCSILIHLFIFKSIAVFILHQYFITLFCPTFKFSLNSFFEFWKMYMVGDYYYHQNVEQFYPFQKFFIIISPCDHTLPIS